MMAMLWKHASFDVGTARLLDELGFLGFWECDYRRAMVCVSPRVAEMLGFDAGSPLDQTAPREIPYRHFESRLHPDDVPELRGARMRAATTSGHGLFEYRLIDKSGAIHWIVSRARYTVDEAGELSLGQGLLLDVTEVRKRAGRATAWDVRNGRALEQVADLALQAYAVAKDIGDDALLEALAKTLIATGRLLSRHITASGSARAH